VEKRFEFSMACCFDKVAEGQTRGLRQGLLQETRKAWTPQAFHSAREVNDIHPELQ